MYILDSCFKKCSETTFRAGHLLVQRATSFEPGFSSPSSSLALLRSTRNIARYASLATPSQRQRLTTAPWLRTYGELH